MKDLRTLVVSRDATKRNCVGGKLYLALIEIEYGSRLGWDVRDVKIGVDTHEICGASRVLFDLKDAVKLYEQLTKTKLELTEDGGVREVAS